MQNRIAKLSLLLTLAAPALAFAHGGHMHLMGTVSAVDASHIEVRERNGKEVSVQLDSGTKFVLGRSAPASASDVAVGKRVVIHTAGEANKPRAAEVQIGASAKKKG